MNKNLIRNTVIAGLALSATYAAAQTYPMEFDVSPAITNVNTSTTFFLDIVARTTDGLNHNLSLAEILVQWTPTFFAPLDNGSLDPWYVAQNGFNTPFPPLMINSDGSQLGLIGGANPLAPQNVSITPTGTSIVRLRFRSTTTTGQGNLGLPSTYGSNDFMMQYNDPTNGVQTLFVGGISGLNGGIVNVHPVPEPASLACLAIGGLGLLVRRRRQRAA